MIQKSRRNSTILTVVFTFLCVVWVYPIVTILLNSLKDTKSITTRDVFNLPNSQTFAGLSNYVESITGMNFLKSFFFSLLISVTSVVLILLCCSMAAWYVVRVNSLIAKIFYYLCIFSMVVPFQMVMFTLATTADRIKLNTPYNICVIYLGFGAGLAVFMFTPTLLTALLTTKSNDVDNFLSGISCW